MGIERIFAFENYTLQDHFKTRGRHEEVLKFLYEVIKDVQFRVEDKTWDPKNEMCARKQFVVNYVHEREKKREEETLQKNKMMEEVKKKRELENQQKQREQESQRMKEEHERAYNMRREQLERQRQEENANRNKEYEEHVNIKPKNPFFGIFKKGKK
ncbi:troponin T-like [Hyperolius riggenbachi]|uniref:troponin T-like n=1 Tax=Hyperolius riggenbachi TaxID=752182 RepID=UPI0035A2BC61